MIRITTKRLAQDLALLGFAIYLVLFIDSLSIEPRSNFYDVFSYLFIVAITIYTVLSKLQTNKIISKKKNDTKTVFNVLLLYYTFFAILTLYSPMKEHVLGEYMGILKFLVVVILMVNLLGQQGSTYSFIKTTYYTVSFVILYLYIINSAGVNISAGIFSAFSGANRVRNAYGLYNVNGTGNLVAMAIIMGVLLFGYMKTEETVLKKTKMYFVILLEAVNIIVLLTTGSRNALVTIIGFFLSYTFIKVTNIKGLSNTVKIFIRIIILISGVLIVLWGYTDSIYSLMESSYRLKGITVNLPLLANNNRLLFGLGIFSPGLFGQYQIKYGASFALDNYYLYLLLETGIIGLIIVLSLFFYLWKKLSSSKEKNKNWIMSAYIAWLVSGIAETCVIYPKFPSSLVFLVLFTTYIKESQLY